MKTLNFSYESPEILQEYCHNENFKNLYSKSKAILVQIFSGIIDEEKCLSAAKAVKKIMPKAQIIGTTTAGGISEGRVSTNTILVAISFFEATTIEIVIENQKIENQKIVANHITLTAYQIGEKIGNQLENLENKVFIAFGTSVTLDTQQVLQGLGETNPNIPVAGGNAANSYFSDKTYVFTENEITDCGFIVAALRSTDLKINRHSHLSWQPIGKEMKITKASYLKVHTIDGMPALDIYKKYLSEDIENNFVKKAMMFPFLVQRNGVWVARVVNTFLTDGTLVFNADLHEGEMVQFGFGNIEMILASTLNLVAHIIPQNPETLFVYSCAIRHYFMQESIEMETLPLQNVATMTGFFTLGEYFHSKNTNEILNTTMTILALSECPKAREFDTILDDAKILHKENLNEYAQTLMLLTNLVNTVTDELKGINAQLNETMEEVNQTNEELHSTLEIAQQQKEEIETQRDKIEKHNHDITSSINYAKRIQNAILPTIEEINTFLPNIFILFRPRDVVSGDFYWFGIKGNKIVFAVIDCTGHGVPGAFMTLIANDLLNQIVLEKNVVEPHKILNELHLRVRKSLRQSENDVSDGMEIAICTIDKWAKKVQYSGAKMDLYWVQNGECKTIQANNYPIGGEQREAKREFTLNEIDTNLPTTLYMSSDGYKDQFGGMNDKRFMSKNFRNLLFSLVDLPMEVQGEYLNQAITEWMGYKHQQIDDILVVGISI